ncbi:MAG: ABC transporter ATP-binding protein [Lachnospiraceae bacterium]|nr:ABC transporter ATP-binding protein [Lachnospiraceae bacterium]
MTFREGTMILWRTLKLMKKGFVKYLLAILSMSAVLSGFDAVTALLLKDLMARMTQDQNRFAGLSRELVLCLLAGSLFLGIYAASFFVYTMEAKKGGANLQKLLYSKCLRLPYEYYEDHHSG